MARDFARDWRELPDFAARYIGRYAVQCIDDYAAKRRVATHRIGATFWSLVDEGAIVVEADADGSYVIKG